MPWLDGPVTSVRSIVPRTVPAFPASQLGVPAGAFVWSVKHSHALIPPPVASAPRWMWAWVMSPSSCS